ncbi:hypothetical protein [Paenibacillus terrae]|uniref:hypothetical protein n=1 Tax=Paenibacillus terrae TaxID=159743 RepID=UPI0011EB90BC|nr:hypothetical protein [Paenibacillus terrae]
MTRKNIYDWFGHDPEHINIQDFTKDQSRQDIRTIEGILIESYRKKHKKLPLWNRMSGSLLGQKNASANNYELVKGFTTISDSPLLSRYSLRELSAEPIYEGYENFMHSARILMLRYGITFDEALGHIVPNDSTGIFQRIIETGYFKKIVSI